jgi:hypothetical protein
MNQKRPDRRLEAVTYAIEACFADVTTKRRTVTIFA